jgi:tetratricopeptide (TPR) repeat protein
VLGLRRERFNQSFEAALVKPARLLCILGILCALLPALFAAAPAPEKFEPYLREHPDDELQREAAIQWYAWKPHDFERLRHHTLEMVERHPSNMQIFFKNSTEFLARPDYHAEVLHRLEERVKTKPSSGAYWVLALTCQWRAVPPDFSTEAKKRRFLSYHLLESEAGLPKQVDPELVAKTIRYFKKAVELATEDESRDRKNPLLAESARWHQNFYARQLMDFYTKLNRHAEALELCQTLARRKENLADAEFLLTYGQSLYASGQRNDAEKWLIQVRRNDREGAQRGPARTTVKAETTLGLIAIDRGDLAKAAEHLEASTKVQKRCNNGADDFPTVLAAKLLEKGRPTPVVRYCETVLRDFTPDQDAFKALLEKAKAQQKNAKN